jgi:carboxypeptidase family protein/TonB-dependent receptor-like protein
MRGSMATSRTWVLAFTAVALAAGGLADTAGAQRRNASLVGWVRDSTGAPIVAAEVNIAASTARGQTDSTGLFRLRALDPGLVRITIRRLGYDPAYFDFQLHGDSEDSIAVTLQAHAHQLDPVLTNATLARGYQELQGFYQRRARGGGVFITRDQIEARHTNVLSEVLRDAAGVHIVTSSRGGTDLRFEASQLKNRDCAPDYWLDGQRVRSPHLDDFSATDVEAIELYAGPSTTPMRFSQTTSMATCGTVVLWTRIPGEPPA